VRDERYTRLAHNLINYSCEMKPGEKVLIEVFGPEFVLTRELIRAAYEAGAQPFVNLRDPKVLRELINGASEEQLNLWAKLDRQQMAEMDAYIGVRAYPNSNEYSDIPSDKMKQWSKLYGKPVHSEERVNNTKWVVMRYPNDAMAQSAGMSTEQFEDFYFEVCTLDYSKMSKEMDALVDLMNRTDKVRITGPGTDLTFSIKDIPAIKCDGKLNIPDGEVFTAPVRDSVNGTIQYNAPSLYQGITFDNVRLTFKDGKIVEATANNTEAINNVFDSDEGARYIGEFAIGVNPFIREPMKDILFDEKIDGSFHFTPGQAYEVAYNGNNSSVHWDLVCIQRPEYGGGEIWFDDVLIRKDGRFVLPELEGLNPENLK